ncbi:MAG TPA: T9SS type A sorting domain-containing protein [Cyclobacteriaceae bacterium]|nr:T9SS type A sorting domain-containing protein [Cyclobacteriaceae bacterium]
MKSRNLLFISAYLLTISTAIAQFSLTPPDSLIDGYTGDYRSVLMIDLDQDGIDEIIHAQNNQIYMVDDQDIYSHESLIYTHGKNITFFSNKIDMNGDANEDFAFCTEKSINLVRCSPDSVWVTVEIQTDYYVPFIRLTDFDRDGYTDILTTNYQSIFMFKNLGEGQFDDDVVLFNGNAEGIQLFEFEIFDMDLDEDSDILTSAYKTTFKGMVLNNDGADHLSIQYIGDASDQIIYCASGDMNLDGYKDIVLSMGGNMLSILLNDGHGNFTESSHLTGGGFFNMDRPLIHDYNKDGREDIIINGGMSELMYASSNGDGTVGELQTICNKVGWVEKITLCKINDDDDADLMTSAYRNSVVLIPTGTTIPEDSIINLPLRPDGHNIGFADMDADGYDDLVQICQSGSVFIYYGSQVGITDLFDKIVTGIYTEGGTIGDYNNDGKIDIIIRNETMDNYIVEIAILENLGERKFSGLKPFRHDRGRYLLEILDIDHDGVNNIASEDTDNNQRILFYEVDNWDYNESNNPDVAVSVELSQPLVTDIDCEDLNSDGWIDLIVSYMNNYAFGYMLNNRQGGFENEVLFSSENYISGVGAGDLDRDSIPELFVSYRDAQYNAHISIYSRNSLDSAFSQDTSFVVEIYEPSEFLVKDFDNNTYPDLLISSEWDFLSINIYLQDEPGLFHIETPILNAQQSSVITDLNQDGLTDFLIVDWYNNAVVRYINNTVFEPENSTTEIALANPAPKSITLKLNSFQESNRLIVVRKEAPVNHLPADGVFYVVNKTLGIGSDLGEGSFAVYSGKDTFLTISGLEEGYYYHTAAFEYNQNEPQKSIINYLTSGYASDSVFSRYAQRLEYAALENHFQEEEGFEIAVTSTSGLDVINEVVSGPIELDGNTATIKGTGAVIIHSSQAGNGEYFPADTTFTFEILEVTGMEEDPLTGIKIFPNPFKSYLCIRNERQLPFQYLRIYDMYGKLVNQIDIRSYRQWMDMDLSNLSPGMHMLILDGERPATFKIIKIR